MLDVTSDQPLLEVKDVRVDFRTIGGSLSAVRGNSFSIYKGETMSIVGESGSGKSVTARAIMQMLADNATVGEETEVLFKGEDLMKYSEPEMQKIRGDRITMIFQEPLTSLNPIYRIGDQVAEIILAHRNISKAEAKTEVIRLLNEVQIPDPEARFAQYPHQLSGGLRQRVMIAMALMCEPELIIADEPTTALDVTIQAQILRLLVDLGREMNMAMILITHDLGVVARVADKVAVMYAGELVETGSATQVFNAPMHPYTRGLLRCIPQPGKTERGAKLGTIPGIVPSLVGGIEGCPFRTRCDQAIDSCRNDIPRRVAGEDHLFRCVHENGYRSAAEVPA